MSCLFTSFLSGQYCYGRFLAWFKCHLIGRWFVQSESSVSQLTRDDLLRHQSLEPSSLRPVPFLSCLFFERVWASIASTASTRCFQSCVFCTIFTFQHANYSYSYCGKLQTSYCSTDPCVLLERSSIYFRR